MSLWCSPVNTPASHAGDHRSKAGQGRQFQSARGSRGRADPPDLESGSLGRASRLAPTTFKALKALSAMHSLGKRISPVQLRVRDPFLGVRKDRSRASAHVGFISPPCPGRHRRLRPYLPPRRSLRIAFVKQFCRSNTGWRLQISARVVQQKRHDVESVASAGATPVASTIFRESKPQQTGTGLLIRYGEVATTSGSTNFCLVV